MDIDLIYKKLMEAGEDYADKKAAYNVLEDTRASVLSKIMLKSSAPSVAAKEMEAKASEAYESHVNATQKALSEYLKAEVKYKAMQTWIDLMRSKEATERALLK